MGYVTNTNDPKLSIETRSESFYLYAEGGIFMYGGHGSVEITYETLARLIVALAVEKDVQEGLDGALDEAIKRVLRERGLTP